MIRFQAEALVATSTELSNAVADALGVSRESAYLHLKTIRKHDKISFKGYGRGAAAMTPLDAARLIIAVAGSTFAKDSMATLNRFCGLLSDKDRRSRSGSRRTLEAFLGERLLRITTDYQNPGHLAYGLPRYNLAAHAALKLIWVAGENTDPFPCFAIVRWFRKDGGSDAMTFSPTGQSAVMLDEALLARSFEKVGLIWARVVTARALEKIAVSLFRQSKSSLMSST
jgi:hypothetical protein